MPGGATSSGEWSVTVALAYAFAVVALHAGDIVVRFSVYALSSASRAARCAATAEALATSARPTAACVRHALSARLSASRRRIRSA